MKQYTARLCASLLAFSLLLSLTACNGQGTTAVIMRLAHTEGRVFVFDGDGEDIPLLENLGLYSGYGVNTRPEGYAWINLDDVKLTKMDQKSELAIKKEGKALDIELKSGSLFFNVTEPLADDETMNIRASTMVIGIRGTCGWVEVPDANHMNVYLLEGKVKCTAGETVTVTAGEVAQLDAKTETVTVGSFTQDDIPAFVQGELDGVPLDGVPGPSAQETPEPAPEITPTPGPAPETTPEVSQITWSLAGGTLLISGMGPMEDYEPGTAPWYEERDSIKKIIIEDGVTGIGNWAFYNGFSLTGATGISMGGRSLTSVTIPGSVSTVGEGAFEGCRGLEDVYYGGSESRWRQVYVGSNNVPLLDARVHCDSPGVIAGTDWNGHTYLVYDISVTWEEARAYCESLGGHLVTITSAEEQQVIEQLLDGGSKHQYWIGLSKTSGVMGWVTNEAFSYANWDSGEPNSQRRSSGDTEQYVHIYNVANPAILRSARFKWNDMYNDNTYPGEESFFSLQYVGFICEWDADETDPGEPLTTDGDRIVFTGTINTYTYDEVLALQGVPDPDLGSSQYMAGYTIELIVLDEPQTMTLKTGDGQGYRSGTVSMIGTSGYEQYDGQHLIFSIDPSRTYWPSGTDLPLGEPGTDDVRVLGAAPSV